jgi:hypothetical protein
LAKSHNRRNREDKKPKAEKKITLATATFLQPQPAGRPPTAKKNAK